MKTSKRIAAAVMGILCIASTACGSSESSSGSSSSMPEKKLEENQQQVVERLSNDMETRELENNTIEWFSFWDINPTASEDKDIGVDLALFQTKYNGVIHYNQTTWENKFDDLAALVMANTSPDFIGADDMDMFPKGAIKGMIEPIDDYIDFSTPLWADMKTAADQFMYQDKHYVAVSRIDPCYIWIYNKNTIDDNGFDQPADLFHEGKWNWDTMSEMCIEFTDAEEDKFALDGWYYENALTQSTGLPLIGMSDGKITNNIEDPRLAKAQDMMYELQKNGVVYPKQDHEWKVRGDTFGEGIGSGLTLFYPIGLWAIEDAPSVTKPYGDLSSGEVMFVPVPCSADTDAQYIPSRIHGFCICKNAKNPEGVAAFLDCTRYAETDEAAHKITLEQYQKDYGWTDEMMDMREEIYALAAEHPVFEFSQGVSKDLANLADNVTKASMHPAEAESWSTTVASNAKAIDYLIDEAQSDLDK